MKQPQSQTVNDRRQNKEIDLKPFRGKQVNIETGFGLKSPECPFKPMNVHVPTVDCCEQYSASQV